MDNLSSHHYEGGAALEEWLGKMGMEFIYTPTYSPDLNPIEEYFSKIKSVLTSEHANNNVYSFSDCCDYESHRFRHDRLLSPI
jgi:transposase